MCFASFNLDPVAVLFYIFSPVVIHERYFLVFWNTPLLHGAIILKEGRTAAIKQLSFFMLIYFDFILFFLNK